MTRTTGEWIPELTALRFFAALAVVLFHLDALLAPDPDLIFSTALFANGYLGVDFFLSSAGSS